MIYVILSGVIVVQLLYSLRLLYRLDRAERLLQEERDAYPF